MFNVLHKSLSDEYFNVRSLTFSFFVCGLSLELVKPFSREIYSYCIVRGGAVYKIILLNFCRGIVFIQLDVIIEHGTDHTKNEDSYAANYSIHEELFVGQ